MPLEAGARATLNTLIDLATARLPGTGCTLFEFVAANSSCLFKTGPLSFATPWVAAPGADGFAKIFAVPDGAGNTVNGVFHAGTSFSSDGIKISGYNNTVTGSSDTVVGDNKRDSQRGWAAPEGAVAGAPHPPARLDLSSPQRDLWSQQPD